MTSNIDWEHYRSFLGVLKEGSLSGAARALGVAQPTVGRHIDALEQSLGLVLFTRSHAGFLPTEAAQSLRVHLEEMESIAAAIERTAASQGDGVRDSVRGIVRVTASEVVCVEVLPPIIAALREQHPDLTVEIMLSNKVQDLLRREADIAVRMIAPQQEQLIARKVGEIELNLHATRDYLERRGKPRRAEDLSKHALIGFDQPNAYLRRLSQRLPGIERDMFSMRSDSDLTQLALIRAGAGIGMCQVPIGKRDGLVRLLPGAISLSLETWVTMHEDLRNSPRCKATFDALVTGLKNYIGA